MHLNSEEYYTYSEFFCLNLCQSPNYAPSPNNAELSLWCTLFAVSKTNYLKHIPRSIYMAKAPM